jgi:hypothetical protein
MNCFSTLAAVPALFCESPGRALRAIAGILLGVLMLTAAPMTAYAVTSKIYCIGDSFQLADVLATGNEGQSVNLDIRLRQGTYTIGTTSYDFIAPTTIRGGWSDQDARARANPRNTVIDLWRLTTLAASGLRAALTIDGVTIRNGNSVSLRAGTGNNFPTIRAT